ncbi:spore wall protein 2-like [Balamuthia mandrillaris]
MDTTLDVLAGGVLLASLWAAGEVFSLFRSRLVGQILVGILLGPGLLDYAPHPEAFTLIGLLGLLLMVAGAGLHLDLGPLKDVGWRAVAAALTGTILPAFCGLGFCLALGYGVVEGLAVGIALSSSSMGMAISLLQQANEVETPLGSLIFAASMLDDIFSLVLLSVLLQLDDVSALEVIDYFELIGVPIASSIFLFLLGGVACWLLPLLWRWVWRPCLPESSRRRPQPAQEVSEGEAVVGERGGVRATKTNETGRQKVATEGEECSEREHNKHEQAEHQEWQDSMEEQEQEEENEHACKSETRNDSMAEEEKDEREEEEGEEEEEEEEEESEEEKIIEEQEKEEKNDKPNTLHSRTNRKKYKKKYTHNNEEAKVVSDEEASDKYTDTKRKTRTQRLQRRLSKEQRTALLACVLLSGWGLAVVAGLIRTTNLLGAFVAGFGFSRVAGAKNVWDRRIPPLEYWLSGIFFVSIGFVVPVGDLFDAEAVGWGFLYALISAFSKIGAGIWAKPFSDSPILGFALVGRGELGFLMAIEALDKGIMGQLTFSVTIWALLLNTFIAPFFFAFFLSRKKKREEREKRRTERRKEEEVELRVIPSSSPSEDESNNE